MTEPARRPRAIRAPSLEVTLDGPWLVASFGIAVRACSWAIVGGGIVDALHVAWLRVSNDDLRPPIDAAGLLDARLRARGLRAAVGLLTSRDVATYSDASAEWNGVRARCIATVGLGNALRAGDPPGPAGRIGAPVGTINVLVHVDAPLSDAALLEANAIATEAKCAIVLEAAVRSRVSGRPATGTGTDCTVVTSSHFFPGKESARSPLPYAGKHTPVGSAVGAAVSLSVGRGVARWLSEAGP